MRFLNAPERNLQTYAKATPFSRGATPDQRGQVQDPVRLHSGALSFLSHPIFRVSGEPLRNYVLVIRRVSNWMVPIAKKRVLHMYF